MKLKLYLFVILLLPTIIFSQKSAPVAGDAAQLIDLLKKDYNSIDPVLRDEQLSKDMFKVVSIFKTYLKDDERDINTNCSDLFSRLLADSIITINKDLKKICEDIDSLPRNFEKYNLEKRYYADSKNDRYNGDYDIEDLDLEKKNYFTSKFFSDLKELEHLRKIYNDSENTYLSHTIKLFIKKYDTVFNYKTDFTAQVNYSSSVQKALPFLGGDLSFETIIDGLSRFLAKRIKEELTTHAMQKIQDHLNNPSEESYLNELLILLPTTTDYLKGFKASQVLNFTDDLKQYIEKDLNNLLVNASNLKSTPRFKKLISNNPDIGFAFEAMELIPQISKIKEPLDYFEILENSKTLQRWASESEVSKIKYNLGNSIKLTGLLAHSLLIIDDGKQKLVSLDFIGNYGSEKEFFLLYIGFLHQQNSKYFNAGFRTGKDGNILALKLDHLMRQLRPENVSKSSDALLFIKQQLTSVATHTEKLQEEINNVKKASKSSEKVSASEVHNLVETFLDFSEEIAATADSIVTKGSTLNLFETEIKHNDIIGKTKPYFNTARSVNNIFLDLHNKKYTTAIIGALEIPANFTNREISLDKVVNLQNTLKASNNLKLIKELVTYEKIPNSDEKKAILENLATRLEYIIEESDKVDLMVLKTKFSSVHEKIIESNPGDKLDSVLTPFKDELKSKYEIILNEYGDIDVNKVLKEPINKIIESNPSIEFKKEELKSDLNNFIKSVFEAYILDDYLGYEKAKNTLLREFTVYLPELSKNVFRVMDNNVLQIIHFITDIAISENAEDVETALEAFALPSGSSSIKEETSGYFAINSYPGLLFGGEFSDLPNNENATQFGITAPIGFYAQFFKSKKGSLGVFLPIIDIGAPVRLRLDGDDMTETLPDFDFKDIFSPGFYVSYGFANSPFSINAGIQYGPKLRGVDNGEGVFIDAESFRIGVGLVIDIPLFTLYTRGYE